MRTLSILALLFLMGGCLSTSSVKAPSNWTLMPNPAELVPAAKPAFDEARLAVVFVRSPFDGKALTVLRPDGSIAFDPYNQFASVPSALIKGTALDVLRQTGLFVGVQPSITTADVKTTLELVVDDISLDCRTEGSRQASVKLTLVMIRNRKVVSACRGEAVVDAAEGNYSAAFGTAFTKALSEAAAKLVK